MTRKALLPCDLLSVVVVLYNVRARDALTPACTVASFDTPEGLSIFLPGFLFCSSPPVSPRTLLAASERGDRALGCSTSG